MGSVIQTKTNNISINYDGMKSGIKSGANVISTSSVGNSSGNGAEEYDFGDISPSLREYSTIQFDVKTIELYIDGLLAKKSELQAKLEVATSPDEIAQLQRQIFMIDFNIYMLNNQKKLNIYNYIANSEDFKNYMANGNVSNVQQFIINSALNKKGPIEWDDESKWMYSYLFETQGKDAANDYYDVMLDIINRQKGLSGSDGMISLTNNAAEVLSSFIPSANEVFNNGGVLSSKEYAEIYALVYHTKMEGTYDATMSEMNQLMSSIFVNSGEIPLYKQTDYPDVKYAGSTIEIGGCGITCAAMLISYFTGKECSIPSLAENYSGNEYIDNQKRMLSALSDNGISYVSAGNYLDMVNAVRDGHIAIVRLNPTSGLTGDEHFVVVTGVTDDGRFLINDPNYDVNVQKTWTNGNKPSIADRLNGVGFSEDTFMWGWAGGFIIDKKDVPSTDMNFMNTYNSMLNNYGIVDNSNTNNVEGMVGQPSINIDPIIPSIDSGSQNSNNINSEVQEPTINIDTVTPSVNMDSQGSNVVNNEVDQVVVDSIPSNNVSYTVSSGDSLYAIAQKYYGDGNRYTEIAAANNITNPNMIYEGQELIIP